MTEEGTLCRPLTFMCTGTRTQTDRQTDHSQSETRVARNSWVRYLPHFCDPRRSKCEGGGTDFGSQFGVQFIKVGKRGSRGWAVRQCLQVWSREMSSSAPLAFCLCRRRPHPMYWDHIHLGWAALSQSCPLGSLIDRPGNLPPGGSAFCHLTINRNHHTEWHVLFSLSTKHYVLNTSVCLPSWPCSQASDLGVRVHVRRQGVQSLLTHTYRRTVLACYSKSLKSWKQSACPPANQWLRRG